LLALDPVMDMVQVSTRIGSMDMVGDRIKRPPPGRQSRQRPGHGPLLR